MDSGPWQSESGALYWIFDDEILVPMEAMDDDDWREALGLIPPIIPPQHA